MKYKNYKSAIHNFTDSFMSIDYTKSGRLAVNSLIDLYRVGIENKVTFDFLNKCITPKDAESKESYQLLNDYLNWLPEHFKNHNCNLITLERLEIILWTDFNEGVTPSGMPTTKEFKLNSLTRWKAQGRETEEVAIMKIQLINQEFLLRGIPEINK